MYTSETTRRFTTRLNDKLNAHVNDCQVCQQGTLCDIAERIIDDQEALNELRKQANQARKLKQAGL